jgi:hypothetical protein
MRGPRQRSWRRRRPWNPNAPTSTAPTPERQGKSHFGLEITEHAGGQLSFRNKTALDAVKSQLTDVQFTALDQFAELADRALRPVAATICSRTYAGMPYAPGPIGDMHEVQRAAYVEFEETVKLIGKIGSRFVLTAFAMVIGVSKENNGAPMSLEEFGATLLKWRDKPVCKGAAAVAIQDTAEVIIYARKLYRAGERVEKRHAASQQEAFEHGRKVERFEQDERAQHKQQLATQIEAHFCKARQDRRGNGAAPPQQPQRVLTHVVVFPRSLAARREEVGLQRRLEGS